MFICMQNLWNFILESPDSTTWSASYNDGPKATVIMMFLGKTPTLQYQLLHYISRSVIRFFWENPHSQSTSKHQRLIKCLPEKGFLQERELSAHFAVLLTTQCFSVFHLDIWDFGPYIHCSDQPILQSKNAAVFSEKAHTNHKCTLPAQVSRWIYQLKNLICPSGVCRDQKESQKDSLVARIIHRYLIQNISYQIHSTCLRPDFHIRMFGVWAFVSVKSLDILKDTSKQFQAVFFGSKPYNFDRGSRPFPAMFVETKPNVFKENL